MAKTTGLASIAERGFEGHMIDPRKLKVQDGWNSRDFNDPENSQYIEDLCANIIAVGGVKQPIIVKWTDGEAYIRDGECRHKAALLAISRGHDIKLVPVRAEDRYASPEDELINQRLRNSSKPFSVFEDAKHLKRLLEMGLSEEDIALKCLISKAQVIRILEHNTIGKVGKDAVLNGHASASLVLEATKELGSAAEQALREGLEKAKKTGKKLKPSDVDGLNKVNHKKLLLEAFEYASVDDDDPIEVVIRMPTEWFDKVKEAFKL